jgi:NAD(P)-dependent dehydrogenase (short-subunit alcohol dehydrogenase family)
MTRTWLITGCSAGFGAELAKAAIAAGDNVMATARTPESITLEADTLATTRLDVTDRASVDAAVAATLDRFGRLDVVVNNAGHGTVGAVEEIDPDDLRAIMDVMFFGAVWVTQAVLPHLRAQGSGTIVQISSMGGQVTMPGFGAYCSAKFALEAMSDALAEEVAPLGIKVHIVEPGAFRTEFGGSRMHRSRQIDAYAASTGTTRDAVEHMDGTQPGDPAKAAQAILRLVNASEAPRRLALGNDAVDAIRQRHAALASDLAAWEPVSRSTDLD